MNTKNRKDTDPSESAEYDKGVKIYSKPLYRERYNLELFKTNGLKKQGKKLEIRCRKSEINYK